MIRAPELRARQQLWLDISFCGVPEVEAAAQRIEMWVADHNNLFTTLVDPVVAGFAFWHVGGLLWPAGSIARPPAPGKVNVTAPSPPAHRHRYGIAALQSHRSVAELVPTSP